MKILGFNISWKGWGKKTPEVKQLAQPTTKKVKAPDMPMSAGRVSPSNVNAYLGTGQLQNTLTSLDYKRLYHLAEREHDFSYAVNNVVQMASTKYAIKFGSDVSESKAKEMMLAIRELDKNIYDGGRTGFVNAILRQCVISGSFSGEATPNDDLSAVKKVTLLEPYRVLFVWDKAKYDYVPYQENNLNYDINYRNYEPNELVGYATRLNPVTYKYIPLDRREDSPYGIPPFLSALEAICIESDMLDNLASVVKRMGLLGFLEVLLPAPDRDTYIDDEGMVQPETDEAYQTRVFSYLQQYADVVESGLAKGYSVGLKRYDENGNDIKHEFNLQQSTSNAQVAKPLMELIMTVKSAGLKQDPVFLGKNFTTSESLAKVLISKFASQLENYQELAAQFISHVYSVHLLLKGFGKVNMDVIFESPLLQDVKTKYEGLNAKFDLHQKLFYQGIINQQQFAQLMGFDAPDKAVAPTPEAKTENNSFNKIVVMQRNVVQKANYKLKNAIEKAVSLAVNSYDSDIIELNEATIIELEQSFKRNIAIPFIQTVRDMVNKLGTYSSNTIKQPELVIENVGLSPIIDQYISVDQIKNTGKEIDKGSGISKIELINKLKSNISPYTEMAQIANTYKNIYILNELNEKSVETFGINDPIGNECCKDSIYNTRDALDNARALVGDSPLNLLKSTKGLITGEEDKISNFVCRCSVYEK